MLSGNPVLLLHSLFVAESPGNLGCATLYGNNQFPDFGIGNADRWSQYANRGYHLTASIPDRGGNINHAKLGFLVVDCITLIFYFLKMFF